MRINLGLADVVFDRAKTNHHGTQSKGHDWNGGTVRGWKLRAIRLKRSRPGISLRFILYFPSGACWYFDIYTR
jgi:hypothetical protein